MRTIFPASLTMTIASGVDSSSSRKVGILVVFTASYTCHVMGHTFLLYWRDLVSADCLGRCRDLVSARSAHEAHCRWQDLSYQGNLCPPSVVRAPRNFRSVLSS